MLPTRPSIRIWLRGLTLMLALILMVPTALPQETDRSDPVDEMQDWEDLRLPPGVEGEVVASGLSFPTGIDWGSNGTMHVSLVGFTEEARQILRVDGNGSMEPLNLTGADMTPQILDLTFHEDQLYWSTTGRIHVKDMQSGEAQTIVTDLPGWGDHRTDEIVFGPDGRLYVGQGTVTNSGVVGFDQLGMPNSINNVSGERPSYRDVPCDDVTLSGNNWETTHPFATQTDLNAEAGAGQDATVVRFTTEAEVRQWIDDGRNASADGQGEDIPRERADDLWLTWPETDRGRVVTGPFSPFATPTYQGQTLEGQEKCNGAVLSMAADGTDVQAEAWGFRNPFALKFDGEGRLWVSDNGPDKRGSRPLGPGPDTIQVIEVDGDGLPWYGWPDFTMGLSYTDPFFSSPWGPEVVPVFEEPPSEPVTQFTFSGAHASSNKFDFGRNGTAYDGSLFMAEFGSLGIHPVIGADAGMSVNRVDMETGRVTEFITSQDRWSGDFRPVEAAFGPDDRLYVLDFGPASQNESDGNETHGQRYAEEFTPESGRILAFTLPDEMDWEGRPAGSPGEEGHTTSGGEIGRAGGGATQNDTDTANDTDTTGTAGPGDENVTVVTVFDYGFGAPDDVQVGDAVRFENDGAVGHTATDYYGAFNSGFSLAPDTTFTWTPSEPGTYRYYCAVHPSMQGSITVQAEGAADGGPADGGTDGGPADEEDDDEAVPGIGAGLAMVALLGAVLKLVQARRR